jgi:hypothetical protein
MQGLVESGAIARDAWRRTYLQNPQGRNFEKFLLRLSSLAVTRALEKRGVRAVAVWVVALLSVRARRLQVLSALRCSEYMLLLFRQQMVVAPPVGGDLSRFHGNAVIQSLSHRIVLETNRLVEHSQTAGVIQAGWKESAAAGVDDYRRAQCAFQAALDAERDHRRVAQRLYADARTVASSPIVMVNDGCSTLHLRSAGIVLVAAQWMY